jgi:thiol-disulfide isomerase/thioredoxin
MSRLRLTLIATSAIVIGAALAVLYVIFGRAVHAPGPPASLARLENVAPQSVPGVAFVDAAGGRHMLAAFKGRYVLLNLWATWCAPCVQELPALARLQKAVPPGRLMIVAVNVGRGNAADTVAFLKAHDAAGLTTYFDPDLALMSVFGAVGLPLSVLVDPKGREVARAAGSVEWGDPAAIAYFKALTTPAAS